MLLERISFSYPGLCLFDSLSMRVPDGEAFALTGSSGCGKTTLLDLICGIKRPDSGSVVLSERKDVGAALRIGYAFSEPVFFPYFSIRRNLGSVCGKSSERKHAIAEGLDELEISEIADRLPSQLSSGQARRAGLLMAFANDPDVVLLDEPTARLDARSAGICRDFLKRRIAGKTALVVTHCVAEAQYLCSGSFALEPGPPSRLSEGFARKRADGGDA